MRFLDKVYRARTADETRRLYDDWATGYDGELAENGYATPDRTAQALRSVSDDPAQALLDIGCGTGLSGEALSRAGFTTIDGCDPSAGMLAEARTKGIYRELTEIVPEAPIPEGYAVMTAIGVIGAGAAPASLLDRIVSALPTGGLVAFSFNDHTLADPTFAELPDRLVEAGDMKERFREYGPHLPAQDLGSTVYILQKS